MPYAPNPTGERRRILEAFDRALDREVHNLSRRPDLVWQQLANRLAWEEDPIPRVLNALARRSSITAGPWFRMRTAPPESGALIRTLVGHIDAVRSCAISPKDGTIVSASDDGTLKLWRAETGEEIRTLYGHTGLVNGCAVSPDGAYVISAGSDATLRIWVAETGEEIQTLRGHTGSVDGCAVSPDGALIVSAGSDATLRIWDTATGKERRTLRGHAGSVTACVVSPDGSFEPPARRGLARAGRGVPDAVLRFAASSEPVLRRAAAATRR